MQMIVEVEVEAKTIEIKSWSRRDHSSWEYPCQHLPLENEHGATYVYWLI